MMTRKPQEPKKTIEIVLFNTRPTVNGRVYDKDTLKSIADSIDSGVPVVIEEIDPLARKKAKTSEIDVWKERIMADSVSCRLDDDALFATFAVRTTRYGKRLQAALDTYGIRGLHFFPVGYGTTDDNGVVKDYHLCYVSFEPRNAIKLPGA